MSIASADFSGEIRRTAAALGRVPTASQVDILQEVLRSSSQVDAETGAITVEIDDAVVPIGDYIAKAAGGFAKLAPAEPTPAGREWVKINVGGSTGWRHVTDPFLKVKASIDSTYDSELAAEMKNWPNPFTKGQENRTRQTVMTNKDPAMAAKLKAEAKR